MTGARPAAGASVAAAGSIALLMVGLVAVSHAIIFARLADAHPIAVAAGRTAVAAAVLLPLAIAVRPAEWGAAALRRAAPAVLAGVFLAVHFASWIASVSLTSIPHSAVLVCLTPVWIALWRFARTRRRPAGGVLFALSVTLAGSVVIALDAGGTGQPPSLTGDLLAVLGGIAMAGYLLVGQRAQADRSLIGYVALCYAVAALVLIVACLVLAVPMRGLPAATYGWILALGLIPQLIGHSIFNWGLRRFSPGFIALFLLGEPVLSAILAVVYFAEAPGPAAALGAVVVVTGLALAIVAERRTPTAPRTQGP